MDLESTIQYPNCNVIDKRDLYYHFKNFGEDNTIFQITDENRERYKEEEGYRHLLSFFSDNNAVRTQRCV